MHMSNLKEYAVTKKNVTKKQRLFENTRHLNIEVIGFHEYTNPWKFYSLFGRLATNSKEKQMSTIEGSLFHLYLWHYAISMRDAIEPW
jgi:hypothetical protein